MKKIVILLACIILCVVSIFAQNTPYGARIRNNQYIVRGSDTLWIQLDNTNIEFFTNLDSISFYKLFYADSGIISNGFIKSDTLYIVDSSNNDTTKIWDNGSYFRTQSENNIMWSIRSLLNEAFLSFTGDRLRQSINGGVGDGELIFPTYTSSQDWLLPDSTGTIALISNIPDTTNLSNRIDSTSQAFGNYLPLSGGTMTGNILMDGNTLNLFDNSGDVASIVGNSSYSGAADIVLGSDNGIVHVTTDGGLYVDNGIFSRHATNIVNIFDGTFTGYVKSPTLTAGRNWTFPDNTGTIALISDIPSGAGLWSKTGGTISTTDITDTVGLASDSLKYYLEDIFGTKYAKTEFTSDFYYIKSSSVGDVLQLRNSDGQIGTGFDFDVGQDFSVAGTSELRGNATFYDTLNLFKLAGIVNGYLLKRLNVTDRTWTLPDSSGTIALISNIPAGAGLWSQTGTTISPTTSTNNVKMTDTLELEGRTRQTFTDLDVTDNDTINKFNASVKIGSTLSSFKSLYFDKRDITFNNNGVRSGKLGIKPLMITVTNDDDSLSNWDNIYALNWFKKGTVSNYMRSGFLANRIWAQGTDSLFVDKSQCLYNSTSIQARDIGSSTYVKYTRGLYNQNVMGDDGKSEADEWYCDYTLMTTTAKTGGTTRIDSLYMNYIHLKDGTTGGTYDIDNIKGLYLYNENNRQGDTHTYGIYEDFGDNYFENKVTINTDTLELANSRTRQTFTDLDVVNTDTINLNKYSIKVNAPLTSLKTLSLNRDSVTIWNNGGINAGKLRFQNYYNQFRNFNDSLQFIFDRTYITISNGIVSTIQRGLSQNTHAWANNSDSTFIAINRGLESKNQIEALDVGSKVYVPNNEALYVNNLLGDDGETTIDSSTCIYATTSIDSKTLGSSITTIDKLYGLKYKLYDIDVDGTVDINNIYGLYLQNEDNRQGDVSTYGIYEDFGDNYFASKSTFDSTAVFNKNIEGYNSGTIDMDDYYRTEINKGSFDYKGSNVTIIPNTSAKPNVLHYSSDTVDFGATNKIFNCDVSQFVLSSNETISGNGWGHQHNTYINEHKQINTRNFKGSGFFIGCYPSSEDTITSQYLDGIYNQIQTFTSTATSRIDISRVTAIENSITLDNYAQIDSVIGIYNNINQDNGMPTDSMTALYSIYNEDDGFRAKDRNYFLYSEWGNNFLSDTTTVVELIVDSNWIVIDSLKMISDCETLAEDVLIPLPDATAGKVEIWVNDGLNNEYISARVMSDGSVSEIISKGNTAFTDTDGNLCLYDSGTGAAIKLRLNVGQLKVCYEFKTSR